MARWLIALLAAGALSACDDETAPVADDDAAPRDATIADLGEADAGCTPGEEICNGADDDCDGMADEGFAVGDVCALEEGTCVSQGVNVCDDDGTLRCEAPPLDISDEICDGADNDCDGAIDEAFDLRVDEANCGECGRTCSLANAESVCIDSDCGISACNAGFRDANVDPTDGCECAESNGGVEACDGVDNDCDGMADEGFEVGEECVLEEGACMSAGLTACSPDGAIVCDAPAIEVGDEQCNGLDDDCDGAIDEEFDADGDGAPDCGIDCDAPCPEGLDCDTICAIQDCAPDDGEIHPQAREICEDGVDQNCDGRDVPCQGVSGWVDTLAIANGAPAGCRDFTGDGRPDNSFAAGAAIANGSIQDSIDQGELNLLPTTFGLAAGAGDAVFDLAVLLGSVVNDQQATFTIRPDSFDELGDPRMYFPNATLMAGAMQAGPGDFLFDLPVLGANLMLEVNDALITGDLDLQDADLSIANGWITGVVPEESFQAALMLLPPEFQGIVAGVIVPDVDTDDDGRNDAYSVCLTYTAAPAVIAE